MNRRRFLAGLLASTAVMAKPETWCASVFTNGGRRVTTTINGYKVLLGGRPMAAGDISPGSVVNLVFDDDHFDLVDAPMEVEKLITKDFADAKKRAVQNLRGSLDV